MNLTSDLGVPLNASPKASDTSNQLCTTTLRDGAMIDNRKIRAVNGFAKQSGREYKPFESFDRILASVRVIDKLEAVSGARNLEHATVDGWKCAVPKAKFKAGELVVYIEIDSFIPFGQYLFPAFDNLQPQSEYEGRLGFHVTTRRIGKGGKLLSQGYVFTVEELMPVDGFVAHVRKLLAGEPEAEIRARLREQDLTGFLGIKKFVSPATRLAAPFDPISPERQQSKSDFKLGKFPAFIKHVRIERVQNCPNFFAKTKYIKLRYQETVKLDGATMTCYFIRRDSKLFNALSSLPVDVDADNSQDSDPKKKNKNTMRPIPRSAYDTVDGRFGVCSSNVDLSPSVVSRAISGVDYWAAALQDGLPSKMAKQNANLAIQGELIGWNIRGNHHNYPPGRTQFYMFAVWDINTQQYWHPGKAFHVAKKMGLRHVPVLRPSVGVLEVCPKRKKGNVEFLERADSMEGEGLVYKCIEDGRWFKVVSNRYLLKNGTDEVRRTMKVEGNGAIGAQEENLDMAAGWKALGRTATPNGAAVLRGTALSNGAMESKTSRQTGDSDDGW